MLFLVSKAEAPVCNLACVAFPSHNGRRAVSLECSSHVLLAFESFDTSTLRRNRSVGTCIDYLSYILLIMLEPQSRKPSKWPVMQPPGLEPLIAGQPAANSKPKLGACYRPLIALSH